MFVLLITIGETKRTARGAATGTGTAALPQWGRGARPLAAQYSCHPQLCPSAPKWRHGHGGAAQWLSGQIHISALIKDFKLDCMKVFYHLAWDQTVPSQMVYIWSSRRRLLKFFHIFPNRHNQRKLEFELLLFLRHCITFCLVLFCWERIMKGWREYLAVLLFQK